MAEARIFYQNDCDLSLLDGKTIATLPLSCTQAQIISTEIKKPGFYTLIASDLGAHAVVLEAANVPIAIDLTPSSALLSQLIQCSESNRIALVQIREVGN